ncbi:MAG: hypothetical protein WBB69_01595 [Anaerolineales bacterium]
MRIDNTDSDENPYTFASKESGTYPIDNNKIGMCGPHQRTWYLKDAINDGWGSVQTVRFGSSELSWVPENGKW